MFRCRTGRLSAAALDQALQSTGSFLVRVSANRPGDVTVTLRKGYTFQRHRCFCVAVRGVSAAVSALGGQQPDLQTVQNRDSSCGWAQLDRVATIGASLSRRVQSDGGYVDMISRANRRHRNSGRAQPEGHGVFTGNWGVSSRQFSTGSMQTRALSTKKSDTGEEHTTDNKGDEQNLKEASTMSTSTAQAPGEPEPEEGKPNKTQQLKKVFKEYGVVGVSFHIGISLMSLGMCYLLISSGIDMGAVLCKVGFSEEVVQSRMAAGTSTFVVAYAIHKVFAPVRMSITVVSVPLIVRYFRKTGLFKPPTPAP